MDRIFTHIATRIANASGQPITFVFALGLIIIWAATGPVFHYSDTWQLIVNTATTVVTFLMVFLIQNSQNRDASAMQAKLDELIRSVDKAREQFIGIEKLSDEELKVLHERCERKARASQQVLQRAVQERQRRAGKAE